MRIIRRRTTVILAVSLPIAAMLIYFAIINSSNYVLTITADKEVYRQGETITFTARNNGFRPLEFPTRGLGFVIINADTGEHVRLGRIYPTAIHYMYPFSWETTSWDQKQMSTTSVFEYEQVEPGNYIASVRTAGGFEPKAVAEVRFRIS